MKKNILLLSVFLLIGIFYLIQTVSASVNVTSVYPYYFTITNTTNLSYRPFEGIQTWNNSVPFLTQTANQTITGENDGFNYSLYDVLLNGTGVVVNRTGSFQSGYSNITVYVVQFGLNSVKVQNGTFTVAGATADTIYAPLSSEVNLSRAAFTFYYRTHDITDDYADKQ